MSASGTASSSLYKGATFYYTPTSCGAANFIIAHAAGLKGLKVEQVDIQKHIIVRDGSDFYKVHAKGNVPCIILADGTILNENGATLQFLAEASAAGMKYVGEPSTLERYKVQNALNFISSEVHTAVGGLFAPTKGETREWQLTRANQKLAYIEKSIGKYYVLDRFTAADSYLHIVLGWLHYGLGPKIEDYPNLKKYVEGILAQPEVVAAKKAMEGNPTTL